MSSTKYDRWAGGGSSGVASYGGGRYYDDDDGGGGFGSSVPVTSREHTRRDYGGPSRGRDSGYDGRGGSSGYGYGYGERGQPPTVSSQSLPLGPSRGRDSGYDGRGGSSGYGYGYGGGRSDDSRYNSSLPISGTHRSDSRYDGYSGGGRGASHNPGMVSGEDYEQRMQAAQRRMEQSSGNSLRVLHETERMGVDTVDALEEQAETLDRVERRLDEMEVDLDQSKRHMRNIKSPFGGVMNYFARRRKVNEITDPKLPKASSAAAIHVEQKRKSKARDEPDRPPRSGSKTTGNDVVDGNLDQMEKALHRLKGIGVLIGDQLDDSEVQIERVGAKMERTDVNMKNVNRDIKRQL